MNCARCGAELTPDSFYRDRHEECTYQFDNALWIGFHGGYGMFVDNVDAKFPTNTDERWIRNSDERDEFGMYCDFKLGTECKCNANPASPMEYHELKCPRRNPVDDPNYVPRFREERTLPGHPDYEAVICHDCAHELCDSEPWIGRLIRPFRSHAHKTEYMDQHPEHWGWDFAESPEFEPPTWLPEHLR